MERVAGASIRIKPSYAEIYIHGKIIERAAGRHAYIVAFIKHRRAQYISFRTHARKLL